MVQINVNAAASVERQAGAIQGLALILPVSLSVMGASLLAPIVPKLIAQFADVPNAQYWVPTLLSVPALCIAIFSPLAGALVDKIGRRRLLIISMLVYAVCGIAPLVLDSFVAIYWTRIGVGICEAFVTVCTTTMICDYFHGAKRDKWLGSQTAIASVFAMFLFPIAGAFGDAYGWRGPFAIYGVGILLSAGVLLFTWEPTPSQVRDAGESREQGSKTFFPWARMIQVCLISLVGSTMFFVVQFQAANAFTELGIGSSTKIGMYIAFASIGVPVGAILFGFGNKHLTVQRLLTIEFLMQSIGFIGMSKALNAELFVLASFVNQVGAGLMVPTLLIWAVQGLAYEFRGRGNGIWQATFAAGQFASTLAFPFVMSRAGGIAPAFQVFSIICALAFVVALMSAMLQTRS